MVAELRRRIRIAPSNAGEFVIEVTYRDPVKAQAIARELFTLLVERTVTMQQEALAKAGESARPAGSYLPGIVGIDTPVLPGEANSLAPPVKNLLQSFASAELPPTGEPAPGCPAFDRRPRARAPGWSESK